MKPYTLKDCCFLVLFKYPSLKHSLPENLENDCALIEKLKTLTPSELVEQCKRHLLSAKIVLNTPLLHQSLGTHYSRVLPNYLEAIGKTLRPWVSTARLKMMLDNPSLFDSGALLFEYLEAHKEIYEEAKTLPNILNRLSDFQQQALEDTHTNKLQEFYCSP